MAGMGPPPKPPGTRARRNASPPTTKLSPAGRGKKRAPSWPLLDDITLSVKKRMADADVEMFAGLLEDDPDARTRRKLEKDHAAAIMHAEILGAELEAQRAMEAKLWRELWRTPQAAIWENLAWSREVAQYVRWKVRGELGDLDAAKEARQWSDRLGLNPLSMLRLRWEIERTEDAEKRGQRRRGNTGPEPDQPAGMSPAGADEDPRAVLRAVK